MPRPIAPLAEMLIRDCQFQKTHPSQVLRKLARQALRSRKLAKSHVGCNFPRRGRANINFRLQILDHRSSPLGKPFVIDGRPQKRVRIEQHAHVNLFPLVKLRSRQRFEESWAYFEFAPEQSQLPFLGSRLNRY